MQRVHVYISGLVQGVFFRAATRRAAAELDLTGWVRNMEDGRVEAVIEGEDESVDQMIAWCRKGPPASRVDDVKVSKEHFTGGFSDFSIKIL